MPEKEKISAQPQSFDPLADTYLDEVLAKASLESSFRFTDKLFKIVYAALPATLETLTAGLHPLTLPGIKVPYYDSQTAAIKAALQNSAEVNGMKACIVCSVFNAHNIQEENPEKGTHMIGYGILPLKDVADVYLVLEDTVTHSTQAFETTKFGISEYQPLSQMLQNGMDLDGVHSVVAALRAHQLGRISQSLGIDLYEHEPSQHDYSLNESRQNILKYVAELTQHERQQVVSDYNRSAQAAYSVVEAFWNEASPRLSDKTLALYEDFYAKVQQGARNSSVQESLPAACEWLKSQCGYVDKMAINNALNSEAVQAALKFPEVNEQAMDEEPNNDEIEEI